MTGFAGSPHTAAMCRESHFHEPPPHPSPASHQTPNRSGLTSPSLLPFRDDRYYEHRSGPDRPCPSSEPSWEAAPQFAAPKHSSISVDTCHEYLQPHSASNRNCRDEKAHHPDKPGSPIWLDGFVKQRQQTRLASSWTTTIPSAQRHRPAKNHVGWEIGDQTSVCSLCESLND